MVPPVVEAEASVTAVPTRALICPLASFVVTSRIAWVASGVPMEARSCEKSSGITTTAE